MKPSTSRSGRGQDYRGTCRFSADWLRSAGAHTWGTYTLPAWFAMPISQPEQAHCLHRAAPHPPPPPATPNSQNSTLLATSLQTLDMWFTLQRWGVGRAHAGGCAGAAAAWPACTALNATLCTTHVLPAQREQGGRLQAVDIVSLKGTCAAGGSAGRERAAAVKRGGGALMPSPRVCGGCFDGPTPHVGRRRRASSGWLRAAATTDAPWRPQRVRDPPGTRLRLCRLPSRRWARAGPCRQSRELGLCAGLAGGGPTGAQAAGGADLATGIQGGPREAAGWTDSALYTCGGCPCALQMACPPCSPSDSRAVDRDAGGLRAPRR